jgi:DNA-binding transcriptional LysR family regulator
MRCDAETPHAPGFMNLARVDLASVRIAVLCAELGSVTEAARRSRCSPSTASTRLKALEEGLDTKLFIRAGNGLRVTRCGDRFVTHGRAVLEHLDFMVGQVRSARDSRDSAC